MGSGIYLLLLALAEVQRVSRPSEQVFFRNQVEAMKQALAERDEETRPILKLWCGDDVPLNLVLFTEQEITLHLNIQRCSVHNVAVTLYLPPDLEFVEYEGMLTPGTLGAFYQGWTRLTIIEHSFIAANMISTQTCKVRATKAPGLYRLGYSITSEESSFHTAQEPESEITIEVVEASGDAEQISNDQATQTNDNA